MSTNQAKWNQQTQQLTIKSPSIDNANATHFESEPKLATNIFLPLFTFVLFYDYCRLLECEM